MKKWYGGFQVAAVYIGTVIGAGFATGKEIVEFFSQYGLYGLLGILFSGYLFITMGTKIMEKAIDLQARSYEELNEYLFGKWFAKAMNILILCMLIGVSGVMLSGAGALFEEQLLVPKQVGVLLTMVLGLAVMAVGTKGLFAVNTFVVPLMITFNLIVMGLSVTKPGFFEAIFTMPSDVNGWRAAVAPLTYAALNLALSQAVLVPIATEINDRSIIRLGGKLGGLFLTIILVVGHFTLVQIPNVASYEIPMAVVMKSTVYGLYWVYIVIIYGEIFTSVIGNMYGLERQIKEYIQVKSMVIYFGIFVAAYLLSWFHYSTLLALLYPIFGWLSLIFILLLWAKRQKVLENDSEDFSLII